LRVHAVSRSIYCGDDAGWLIVDSAFGRGSHALVTRLHLHPDVRVTRLSDESVRLEREGISRCVSILGGGVLSLGAGWYCPRFGERIANQVLELRLESSLPATLGWQITREIPPKAVALAMSGHGVSIRRGGSAGESEFQLPWHPAAG
jgi:uncharacterized heparinase superfamily protein